MTTVTVSDCRKLRYCSSGIRELFRRYNLDYHDFLVNGIDSEKLLEATNNDSMVQAVVEVANGRQ